MASTVVVVRRRPTLPHPLGCSTIGAGWLNFRVRDGAGCFPAAMAAVTLDRPSTLTCPTGRGGAGVVVLCCVVDARHTLCARPLVWGGGLLGVGLGEW